MTPLPKRKHSTRRKGKRLVTKTRTLTSLVICANCGKPKRPHMMCKNCNT